MLEEQAAPNDSLDENKDPGQIRDAWVARTRSGADHHNTLTPRWDFQFSI